jgi:hypothetical protein
LKALGDIKDESPPELLLVTDSEFASTANALAAQGGKLAAAAKAAFEAASNKEQPVTGEAVRMAPGTHARSWPSRRNWPPG